MIPLDYHEDGLRAEAHELNTTVDRSNEGNGGDFRVHQPASAYLYVNQDKEEFSRYPKRQVTSMIIAPPKPAALLDNDADDGLDSETDLVSSDSNVSVERKNRILCL